METYVQNNLTIIDVYFCTNELKFKNMNYIRKIVLQY